MIWGVTLQKGEHNLKKKRGKGRKGRCRKKKSKKMAKKTMRPNRNHREQLMGAEGGREMETKKRNKRGGRKMGYHKHRDSKGEA